MIILAGWVKLHRQIQNHWLWHEKPFDKRSAWIDMILLANHSDNKFVLGNELVSVNKGSFITSELKLMERWGWSKSKVRAFLKILEKDSMIIKKTDKKKTTIIIENYSEYQETQTTKELQKDHKETTKEPQKDTNKNEKNLENEKEDIPLQIKNLRLRYSDEELKIIDNYLDILRWTRKNGKIADSVILKIYQEWAKYSISKVIYALNVYINNPSYHDKKEQYCYGIMRNATADEIENKNSKHEKPKSIYPEL